MINKCERCYCKFYSKFRKARFCSVKCNNAYRHALVVFKRKAKRAVQGLK